MFSGLMSLEKRQRLVFGDDYVVVVVDVFAKEFKGQGA